MVGLEALRTKLLAAHEFVESPKLWLGQESVLIGDDLVAPAELVGEVFRHVLAAAVRCAGSPTPAEVVLTHPQEWAGRRQQELVAAWERWVSMSGAVGLGAGGGGDVVRPSQRPGRGCGAGCAGHGWWNLRRGGDAP